VKDEMKQKKIPINICVRPYLILIMKELFGMYKETIIKIKWQTINISLFIFQ